MANAPISTVDILIRGNASGLQTAIDKATKTLKTLGMGATQTSNSFKMAMSAMATAATRIVAPIGAAVAAYATFSSAMSAINRAGELDKLSKSLDVSVESLQELQFVAGQTGGSAQGLAIGLREMGRFLTEVAQGGEASQETMKKLGLNLDTLRGMKPDEQFYEIADALSKVRNAQERATLAQEIFGRSSRELAETLSTSKTALKDIAKDGRDAGVVLSQMDVKRLEELGDAMDKLKGKMETGVAKVVAGVAQSLTMVVEEMTKVKVVGAEASGVMEMMSKAILVAGKMATDLWYGLQAAVVSVGVAIAYLGQGASETLGQINDALSVLGQWFWEAGKTALAAFQYAFAGIKLVAASTWEVVLKSFAAAIQPIGKHVRELGLLMQEWGIAGADSLVNMGEGAENLGRTLDTSTKDAVASAKEEMATAVDTMSSTVSRMSAVRAGERPEFIKDMVGYFQSVREDGLSILDQLADESVDRLDRFEEAWAKASGGGARDTKAEDDAAAAAEAQRKIKEQLYKDMALMEQAFYTTSSTMRDGFYEAAKRAAIDDASVRLVAASETFKEMSLKAKEYGDTSYTLGLEQLEKEKNLEKQAYDQKLAALTVLVGLQQASQDQIDALKQQHAANQIAFTQEQSDREIAISAQKAAVIGDVMGQAAALMDKNNKAQFLAWKVFAGSQAIINAYLAWAQIMASPFPDFFGVTRTTMANIALGLGLANAAKIAATPYGAKGGSPAGGSMPTPDTSKGSQGRDQAPTNINVSLAGQSFSGDQVRGLIATINEAIGDNVTLRAQQG